MTAYYNEFDPNAAAWLRELIAQNLIAPGVVDERSIEDVRPDELRGYTQCHFFAGIGGWAYALDLAGWPRDRPVWTGSCPCQPFSTAGKGTGFADERHLWPAFQHLIAQCQPPVVFGEQVASKDADTWIDLVHADLEGMGYAFGSIPFPSAGIGAPHIRDRNYWVADADDAGLEGRRLSAERAAQCLAGAGGLAGGLAYADGWQRDGLAILRGLERDGQDTGRPEGGGGAAACGELRGMGYADSDGTGRVGAAIRGAETGQGGRRCGDDAFAPGAIDLPRPGPANGFWRAADWLGCTDGKWRPVEPGTFPLAHGIPARVVRLRGYGNAINPEAAEAFIRAYVEARQVEVRAAA